MERILLLMAVSDYREADDALRGALKTARQPARLTFGLSLTEEPDEEALTAMRALGSAQFLCPAQDVWASLRPLWQGEGYVLIAHPAMVFRPGWDEVLLTSLRRCHRGTALSAVLTGYLPRPCDPVDAVYPVAAEGFNDDGALRFGRGMPLRYAKAPERSAFLHPDFCFAPAAFFRQMAEGQGAPFLRAFRSKWELFTLHRPVIAMQWDTPVPPCPVDLAEEARLGGTSRFEKRFGVIFRERKLSAMARLGIFSPDLNFPQVIPLRVKLREASREAAMRGTRATPLCVTAWLRLPAPEDGLPEEAFHRFSRLARLRNVALLCFADGESLRKIALTHPNVLEYKRRYGLPLSRDVRAENALRFTRLSKVFLLSQGREKLMNHSHYVWVDFGYLRFPVYERAGFDWDALCRERITLATVDGAPDLSMISVPQEMLPGLCREVLARSEAAMARTGRLPEEAAVWEDIMRDNPDWFDTEALAGKHELITLALSQDDSDAKEQQKDLD